MRNYPETLLDPGQSVVVIIDHEPQMYFGVESASRRMAEDSVTGLAKAAKLFKVPCILTTVEAKSFSGLMASKIQQIYLNVQPIDRTSINSWEDENLKRAVEGSGRKRIVLAGLWTEACVAFPALCMKKDGYDVYVVTDACGGATKNAHDMAVLRMAQAGIKPVTWMQVMLEWQRDWNNKDTYDGVMSIIKEHGGAYGLGVEYAETMLKASHNSQKDGGTRMSKYPILLSEGHFGKVVTKNRIVMPPMVTNYCDENGSVTPEYIAYHEARAAGGVGLIITEATCIDKDARGFTTQACFDSDDQIPGYKELVDRVHRHGAKMACQIFHGGRQASIAKDLVAPSAIPCNLLGMVPRELSVPEIKKIVQDFVDCAVRVKKAGFDAVELHAGHGYLIHQFFAPLSNQRTDEYGGSFENRVRFAAEIIQGIKKACGADFPICTRLSIDEFTEGGFGMVDGVKIAKAMEDAGADVIHASMCTYDAWPVGIEPAGFREGWRVYLAEAVKRVCRIPVIAVGAIRHAEYAEQILREKRADFVAIGRGNIADPDLVKKIVEDREDEQRLCISCMYCALTMQGLSMSGGARMLCTLNPRVGREDALPQPKADGGKRKVIVAGGGPAGMQAAITLAQRDFNVVLMEKAGELGGQMILAEKPLNKYRIGAYTEYGKTMLKKLGVDVRLNTEATADSIEKEQPFALVVATGGVPIMPKVPGIKGDNVIRADELLNGDVDFRGKKLVIIGGGQTGCETAVLAGYQGNEVTIVEMQDAIVPGIHNDNRIELLTEIEKYQVDVQTNAKLVEIDGSGVTVENTNDGSKREIAADAVVLALGVTSDRKLYDEFKGKLDNIYLLGDADHAGQIADAVSSAYEAAINIG